MGPAGTFGQKHTNRNTTNSHKQEERNKTKTHTYKGAYKDAQEVKKTTSRQETTCKWRAESVGTTVTQPRKAQKDMVVCTNVTIITIVRSLGI